MNPWDLLTWICAVLLAVGASLIFAFFAKDAREIFQRKPSDSDEDECTSKKLP